MLSRLRILHISDLHIRGDREKEEWRRRRVLGDEWKKNLEVFLEEGPVDVVAFTGDLAFSGRPGEYVGVSAFIDAVLEQLKLGRDRLFVVPGNHDVDRNFSAQAWSALRGLLRPDDALELSRWMASEGEWAPRGFNPAQRDEVLARQAAYRDWVRNTLGRPELLPDPKLHARLGYRVTFRLPGRPFDLHVIGLDSAWLAGDEHDTGRLWLTDDQVMRLATDARGGKLPGFRLALIHHPLDNLVDRTAARRLLAEHVDLLLRGHMHEPEVESSEDPERTLRSIAAGCLYEHDRYPNSCQLIQVSLDAEGRPLSYDLRFRSWSSRGHWYDDDGLYAGSRGGRLRWGVRPMVAAVAPHREGGGTFVGREDALRAMEEALLPVQGTPRPVALQGMPGAGKTYLMERWASLFRARFPGGYVRIALESHERGDANAMLQALADRLELRVGPHHLEHAIRQRLLAPATLLGIDNVDSPSVAAAAAEMVRRLGGCAIIVVGRLLDLGLTAGWAVVKLRPFDDAFALMQLAAEFRSPRDATEDEAFHRLGRELGGLPLAIHLAAGYLRKGRTVDGFLAYLRRRKLDLGPGDLADPLHAEGASRAILRRSFDLSLTVLRESLSMEWGSETGRFLEGLSALGVAPASGVGRSLGASITGLSEDDFGNLVALATELSVVDRVPEAESPRQDSWRVHPLLAEMLREGIEREKVLARMTAWFVQRLPDLPVGQGVEQGRRWRELQNEESAMRAWLPQVPRGDLIGVERAAYNYAQCVGPFLAWLEFCRRMSTEVDEPEALSHVFGTLANVAMRIGLTDEAWVAAQKKWEVDRERNDTREEALAVGVMADVLEARDALDEALRLRREEELPVYARLGDVRSYAVCLMKIADLQHARGEQDAALDLWRQMVALLEKTGHLRERACGLGRIADVLFDKSDLDAAFRIWSEEVLPVYERLGESHERAATLGRLAAIHKARGETQEARRLLQEEVLPVFERLGNIRSYAATLSQVAHLLGDSGDTQGALEILRGEVLPVFRQLGDARLYVESMMGTAEALKACGEWDEALRLLRQEGLPFVEGLGSTRWRIGLLRKIAEVLQARGEMDEALRILREEVLPEAESLDGAAGRVATLERIADLFRARGELDEALRLLRDEVLPIVQQSGNDLEYAAMLGRFVRVLHDQGEWGEALRVLRDEALPAVKRSGNVRWCVAVLRAMVDVLHARGELDEALRVLREEVLPSVESPGLMRERARALDRMVGILLARQDAQLALSILRDQMLPLLEKLGAESWIEKTRTRIAELVRSSAPTAVRT